jgi:alpha-L-rhamnosidase
MNMLINKMMTKRLAKAVVVLLVVGALPVCAAPALKDYGLKEYVYTSKDLPRVEANTWRLVCQLPYNAQFTAWIEYSADAAGKVVGVDSSNPLVRSQQQEQKFPTVAGVNTWEMPGWVSGEGAIYTIPAGVKVLNVKYRETGYATEVAGSFICNDEDYNSLWQKATRTLYLCMREHYMDCPDRERAEWLGDAVLQMEECFHAYDLASHQMAKRLILSKQINGLPGQNLIAHGEYGDWCYYLYTGDLETLAAVYDNTKKYLAQYQIGTNGLPVHRSEGWDWYDWGTGYQDKTVLQVAEYYSALSALRKMAVATGHQDDLASIDAKLSGVRNNFNSAFWKENGYRSGKELDERANAMAVCAGLADPSTWPVITGVLGTNGNCGPYFERWVLEALCVMGKPDLALIRMANRYRGQIDARFTTLWEYMERGFPDKGGTDAVQYLTLNHAWNTPNTILSKFIAGIAPDSPGWAAYHVLPQEAFLTSLETKVPTVKGEVALSIRKTASTYSLSLVSPAKTIATVGIPRAAFSELRSITVNGKPIWDGAHTGSVEGVSPAGEDALYVKFSVKPGSWTFVGSGLLKTSTPKPPAAPRVDSGKKLVKKDWTTCASVDNKTFGAGPWQGRDLVTDASSANAIDGDCWTGWRTMGQDQIPGQWFVVDMQRPQEFNRIVMDNVWAVYDTPAGYDIYVSDDGKSWGQPVASGKGGRWGVTTATFEPVKARYIKVEQTGQANQFWSIFEIDVYKP